MPDQEYNQRKSRYDELLVLGKRPEEAYKIAFNDLKEGLRSFEDEMETTYHRNWADRNENRRQSK